MPRMYMSNNQVHAISRNRNEQKTLFERIEQLDQNAFQSKGAIKQDMRTWKQFKIQNNRNSGWSSKSLRPEPGEDVFQSQGRSNRSNSPTQGKDTYSKPWAYTYSHESHNKVYKELAQVAQSSKKALDLTFQAAQAAENEDDEDQGEVEKTKPISKFKALSKTVSLLAPRQKLLPGRATQETNFFDLAIQNEDDVWDEKSGSNKIAMGIATVHKISKFSSVCKANRNKRTARSEFKTPSDALTKSISAIKGLAKSKRIFKCIMCGKHADDNTGKPSDIQNIALAYRGLQRAQAVLKSTRNKMNKTDKERVPAVTSGRRMCLCCQMMYERKSRGLGRVVADQSTKQGNDVIETTAITRSRRSLSSVVDLTDEQKIRIKDAKRKVSKFFDVGVNDESFDGSNDVTGGEKDSSTMDDKSVDRGNNKIEDGKKVENSMENELNEIAKTANAVVEDEYECDNESHQRVMQLLQEEVIDKLNKITTNKKNAAAARKFSTVSRASSLFRHSQQKKKKTYKADGMDVFTRIAKHMLFQVWAKRRERERLRALESQNNHNNYNNRCKNQANSGENKNDLAPPNNSHLTRKLSYVNPEMDLSEWNSRKSFKEGGWLVSRKASVIEKFRKSDRRDSDNTATDESRRNSKQTTFELNKNVDINGNSYNSNTYRNNNDNDRGSDRNVNNCDSQKSPTSLKPLENRNDNAAMNSNEHQFSFSSRDNETNDKNNNISSTATNNDGTSNITTSPNPSEPSSPIYPIIDSKNKSRKPPWISGNNVDNLFRSRSGVYHKGVRISNYVHPERRYLTSAKPGTNGRKAMSLQWHSSAGATVVQHRVGDEPGIGEKTFSKQARHRALHDMIEANHTPEPDESIKQQKEDLDSRVNHFLQSISRFTQPRTRSAMEKGSQSYY